MCIIELCHFKICFENFKNLSLALIIDLVCKCLFERSCIYKFSIWNSPKFDSSSFHHHCRARQRLCVKLYLRYPPKPAIRSTNITNGTRSTWIWARWRKRLSNAGERRRRWVRLEVVRSAIYACTGVWRDSLRMITLSDSVLSRSEGLNHAEGPPAYIVIASSGALSEGYGYQVEHYLKDGHGGPVVCLGDGQT